MYQLRHKVRYSEISSDKSVDMAQIVNYLQDCSTFESVSVGDDLEHLEEKKCTWLLAAWQIEVKRYPKMAEEIVISSWHSGHKGVLAHRNFQICDEKGEQIVLADSIWFYFDLERKVPRRIAQEYVDLYGYQAPLCMEVKPRKITLPDVQGIEQDAFPVRKSDLDTNGHVNNAKYIAMALEYGKNCKINKMRADYRKSALYGERIYPVVFHSEDKIYVQLNNKDGDIFVIVELEYEPSKQKGEDRRESESF